MLWIALAFIVLGVLLHSKGKKEENSVMKIVGVILIIVGIVLLLAVFALIGWGVITALND
jgi:hypothetical protein